MIRAASGLLFNFITWLAFGLAALVAFDGVAPGAGMRVLEGVIAVGSILADSLPAGVVAGLLLVLPAFYLGNRVTVDKIYADSRKKIETDREKYTL